MLLYYRCHKPMAKIMTKTSHATNNWWKEKGWVEIIKVLVLEVA
jgi:hypothetical protein